MNVAAKARYAKVLGAVKKMGVMVDTSKGMVFLNAPCSQIRVQLFALFSILVPFGRG
jgi:hypothetical protein